MADDCTDGYLEVLDRTLGLEPDEDERSTLSSLVLDATGVALAGAETAVVARAANAFEHGRSVSDEAFLNAVAVHALDFDDTHAPSLCHTGATLLPALLALGRDTGSSGADFLRSYASGLGLASWLSPVGPALNAAGYHSTGVVGAICASAASSRLLGLDVDQALGAMQLAATMASGLCVSFGTDAKPLQAGHAAEVGVRSALMARAGLTAAQATLAGRGGLLDHLVGVTSLGPWRTSSAGAAAREVAIKPYPCCVLIHAAIDATLEARDRVPLAPLGPAPVEISVTVNPLVTELADKRELHSENDARFSLRFCVLAAWHDGRPTLETFGISEVERALARYEALGTGQDAVTVRTSAELDRLAATVTFSGAAKDDVTVHCPASRGTPDRPMTESEIADKFLELAVPRLGEERATATRTLVAALGSAPDLSSHPNLFPFDRSTPPSTGARG